VDPDILLKSRRSRVAPTLLRMLPTDLKVRARRERYSVWSENHRWSIAAKLVEMYLNRR